MGSLICLSSAPNLRCEPLSRVQYEVLIIPPALEVIFCVSLIFTKLGSSSRRHLLLVAEGWAYFSLALFDMLSHVAPAARSSTNSFDILDIFIASTSFLPLLLYTLFLYLFVSEELLKFLPRRYQPITKCTIMIFIPTIPALNEIASFVGISRTISGSISIIGFSSKGDQDLWTFFSSITLALLTAQQTISFFLLFYQIVCVCLDQRRIKASRSDEAHPFNGIGWMATGIKLGVIETVIGFTSMGFGGVLSRRILRLLGRACLMIGVVKGMDRVEDFRNLHNELRNWSFNRPYSKSKIKPFISNPRNSTFRRLSPSEIAFHDTPRGPHLPPDPFEKSPSIITTFAGKSPTVASTKYRFSSTSTSRNKFNHSRSAGYQSSALATPVQTPTLKSQRVTVHYEQGHAPTLEVRFSSIDLPCAVVLADDIKFRPQSEWLPPSTPPSARLLPISEFPNPPSPWSSNSPITSPKTAIARSQTFDTVGQPRYMRENSYVGHARVMSAQSLASDSLDVIRDLAGRFPGLPPRITAKSSDTLLIADYDLEDEYPVVGVSRQSSVKTFKSGEGFASTINAISRSNSLAKRKPVPPVPPIHTAGSNREATSMHTSMHTSTEHEDSDHLKDDDAVTPSPYKQESSSFSSIRRVSSVGTADVDDNPFMYDDTPSVDIGSSENGRCSSESVPPAEWLGTASKNQSTMSVDIEAYRNGVGRASQALSDAPTERGHFGTRIASTTSLEIPWPIHVADADFEAGRETWSKKDLTRIKSVGKAPKKMTPTPTHAEFLRESITLERMGIHNTVTMKTDDKDVTHVSDTQ